MKPHDGGYLSCSLVGEVDNPYDTMKKYKLDEDDSDDDSIAMEKARVQLQVPENEFERGLQNSPGVEPNPYTELPLYPGSFNPYSELPDDSFTPIGDNAEAMNTSNEHLLRTFRPISNNDVPLTFVNNIFQQYGEHERDSDREGGPEPGYRDDTSNS